MRINILSIFPELFENFLKASLIGKATEKDLLRVAVKNIRDFAEPPHYHVDDTPYGGGPGMVMMAEPILQGLEAFDALGGKKKILFLTPSGTPFRQAKAVELSELSEFVLVCGRYEGFDQRAIEISQGEEISIGDYVLMGGEIAAMAIIESCARLLPEVVGNSMSVAEESFAPEQTGELLLEAPQYTKPQLVRGTSVPDVLLSGDHHRIADWRKQQSKERTARIRPDLLPQ